MWSSISIPLVSSCSVPFLSEKQDGEINTMLGYCPTFTILIIPRHHCPKPGTCLEWKGKQNKIKKKKIWKWSWKKGEFWWMGEMWTPLLYVCKCAEKPVDAGATMCFLMYMPLQTSGRWAHFSWRESDRNLSTGLIIPQLQQFIVCFPQGHLYQQPNKSSLPAFVPKGPMRPL